MYFGERNIETKDASGLISFAKRYEMPELAVMRTRTRTRTRAWKS
jgi:hypothetical protein